MSMPCEYVECLLVYATEWSVALKGDKLDSSPACSFLPINAKRIITEIVKKHGFVSKASLDLIQSGVSQEVRREVEEALLAKDQKIGWSILTLAKNLYTSQARFVFELLQNADDNQYTRGQDPYVLFRVYPDRIVIECNEDGFSEKNLTAICDIGKSSKRESQGYIGEKGIGFKSVFMAAWKVHIQSREFSFDFVHRKGDSGMGMITPIWQENSDPTLPYEVTRITLYLHDQNDPAERGRDRQLISEQFLELQDTLLLFLRRLQKIEVSFNDEKDQQINHILFTLRKLEGSNVVVIERRCTDSTQNRDRTYHIVKHTAKGLVRSENRELSEAEETSRSFATSEIVLAFPISKNSASLEETPVIEPQEVFAFLPIRKMGFNFLIQADFVTQANRQDIVMTSRRNQGLINAIADAFVEGVKHLCNHKTLQYQWMRYLPLKGNYPWDGLWKDLVSKIKSELEELSVLRSYEGNKCRTIAKLYYRKPELNDRHGTPLFADLRPETYLSDSYTYSDIEILKKIGLQPLPYEKTIKMVTQDLQLTSENSRIKRRNIDDDWQTRAYKLLNMIWDEQKDSYRGSLKELTIIPLHDGSWGNAVSGKIFFPRHDNIAIPKGFGITLVDSSASTNRARHAFFKRLGVLQIGPSIIFHIRERILELRREVYKTTDLQSSIEQIKFLFLTENLYSIPQLESLSGKLLIYNHLGMRVAPDISDLYIPNDDPWGAERFLRRRSRTVHIVNSRYFEEIPSIAPGSNLTLEQWMHERLGIRQHLRLVSASGEELSDECLDTAKTRPAEFLGFLAHLWPFEEGKLRSKRSLLADLKKIPVLCMNEEMEGLQKTYLPLQPLLAAHKQFMGDEYFPFIHLPELSGQDQVPEVWSFLVKMLGVSYRDIPRFRLQLMACLKEANEVAENLESPSRVIDLYQSLDACVRMLQASGLRQTIKIYFDVYDLIFVPPWKSSPPLWTAPDQCLWSAPADFETKIPLKEIYANTFNHMSSNINHLAGFFHDILEIEDIGWSDVIHEFRHLKDEQSGKAEVIRRLLEILSENLPTEDSDKDEMREHFEEGALIYFDHNGTPGWHRPSGCVWSDTIHIHGKIAVNSQYGDFKDFFIEQLRIPQVDLTMVVDQLLEARSLNLPVSEVKDLLKTLNSFLRTEASPPSPRRLLSAGVFPVKKPGSGTVVLCTSKTEFALIDREGPLSRFTGLIKVLDFTLQEICELKPFITWAGLESRYLSKCIREISRVGDGVQLPISQPQRDLRLKAHALLRITAAFGSPRYLDDPVGLYRLLRNAVTVECGVISSSLRLEQDEKTHEVEIGQSELHIEDTNPLKIYVPKDVSSQECCFKYDLPRRFALWMMTDPITVAVGKIEDGAINVINSILNCILSTTERILEKEGIPDVTGVTETPASSQTFVENIDTAVITEVSDEVEVLPATSAGAPVIGIISTSESASSSLLSRISRGRVISAPVRSTPIIASEGRGRNDDLETSASNYSTPLPRSQPHPQESPSQYRQLLERVVELAKNRSLPNQSDDISAAFRALGIADNPFEGVSYGFPTDDWERKKKVGAAGELFVFTILSRLLPSHFDLENWRSTIRGLASVLPEYQDLNNWQGRETSDIVYDDVDSSLTTLMISHGYLISGNWVGRRPKYYIEVKCTTGPCETPFFVSQEQVNLMERTTNGPNGDQNRDAIYAVFRVYHLGNRSMGLKIYVDPAEQRRVGKLSFASEKYAVTSTAR